MKKFLLSLAVLFTAMNGFAEDKTVTIDFTSAAEINALGIATPANGAGTEITAAIVKDGVTITNDNATATTPTRMWATNSGVLDLRIYKNAVITVACPEGKFIKTMTWTTANAVALSSDTGTATGAAWTGEANTVVLSCTSNTRINVLTVTYGDHENPSPDDKTKKAEYDFTVEPTVWGLEIPASGQGTTVNGKTLTSAETAISFEDNGAGTTCRYFLATNGNYNIRTYAPSITTFSVEKGNVITAIEITSGNATNMTSEKNTWSAGTMAATCVWTPNEGETVDTVTLTAGVTLQLNKVVIKYDKDVTSAIKTVNASKANTQNLGTYNLMGQRISGAKNGIVIMNGKKYLVK
ncbi:MAG: hypothetical protein KBT39_00200 [Bacteroidales bacterium]|nr:hypothetical protein [Bacteroidales bacterium]